MAELGDHADAVLATAGDAGQVGTRGEDERLAGDADRGDLVVGERRVDRGVQRQQERGPKVFGFVWSSPLSRVIRPTPAPAPRGQGDLAQLGLGDALGVRGDLRGAGEQGAQVGGRSFGRSSSVSA